MLFYAWSELYEFFPGRQEIDAVLEDHILRLFSDFDSETICWILKSHARANHRPSWAVLGALDSRIEELFPFLSPSALVVILKSYVKLRLRPDDSWMDQWSSFFLKGSNAATLRNLSDALWALAKVQYEPPEKFLAGWIARFTQRLSRVGQAEATRMLNRTRWAMQTFRLDRQTQSRFN